MALAITNLHLDDIASALGNSTTEVDLYDQCNDTAVNSAGLNATYCPGADAAERLTNLQGPPCHMSYFRGYDHNAGGSYTNFIGTDVQSTSATACVSKESTDYWHDGTGTWPVINDTIFTNSGGTTYPSDGYIGINGGSSWVQTSKSVGAVELTGSCSSGPYEIDAKRSLTTCGTPASVTVWSDSETILDSVINDDSIYTTSAQTTIASSGYYFDASDSGDDRYQWQSFPPDWVQSVDCSASLTSFTSVSSPEVTSLGACEIEPTVTLYHNGTGTYPTSGNTVYSDSNGSLTVSDGWRRHVGNGTFSCSSGVVEGLGACRG